VFFEFLQKHNVRGGIAEQVLGFGDRDGRSDAEALGGHASPLQLFCHKLQTAGYVA
jgi:hypothetical protein